MTTTLIPLPAPPTLEQAVRRYWELKHLEREGAVDSLALVTSLVTLAKDHPRLAPLCCRTILRQDHHRKEPA